MDAHMNVYIIARYWVCIVMYPAHTHTYTNALTHTYTNVDIYI